MGSISLDDVDKVEISPGKDWLGMEQEVQACSTTISTDNDQPNEQDNIHQDNSDLLPFDTAAQQLISNLSQLKDCEFDHN